MLRVLQADTVPTEYSVPNSEQLEKKMEKIKAWTVWELQGMSFGGHPVLEHPGAGLGGKEQGEVHTMPHLVMPRPAPRAHFPGRGTKQWNRVLECGGDDPEV